TLNEERIAITEDGRLAELFIELPEKERSIGNIFLGRVTKIVEGINAAFINIGQNQDAFLHFSDIDDKLENIITDDEDEELYERAKQRKAARLASNGNKQIAISTKKPKPSKQKENKLKQNPGKKGNFRINLVEGQNIIVQIVREAYSSKGVKVTTRIGIPGRYVVLMPFDDIIGLSKKISSLRERRRLRQLARNSLPAGQGCIIRTAAQKINEHELLKDWDSLEKIWNEIELKVKRAKEPMLLYQDLPIATSVIRDLMNKDVTKVVIDSKKLYKDINNYLKWASPAHAEKISLYNESKPIFEHFGIEKQLEQTYKRKVRLPNGGTIVIDQAEAMVVVDVNSGKAISEREQEKNALQTNLEAVKEIARQVRLRDIGGIILVDFIDMRKLPFRKKVYGAMRTELVKDRAKTIAYPLTQLNLMQITRQRVNLNITEKLSESCPMCQGTGKVISKGVLSTAIERWLKNFRANSREFRLILHVHPNLAEFLSDGTISKLSRMMIKYFVKIKLQQSNHIRIDEFKFYSVRQEKDITQEFLN
ncbi:MAG: Rne/Rng family ribonuclease, partial [Ignavibacteriae bacterium]|nr:Rne/Rng family ribonuclease [Ignavibacteriota bacterium]